MSLLTVVQDVARNTALDVPQTASGSTDRAIVNVVQFVNDAGTECARRVDWGALRKTTSVVGTGAAIDHALPSDFSRLIDGNAVNSSGVAIRGGLSADEWASLVPVVGTPRFFRKIGSSISLFPFLANAATATVIYQSLNWVSGNAARMTLDAQTALFPEDLLIKGAIWRQRRHVGQDFADQLSEFEAALADYSKYEMRARSP